MAQVLGGLSLVAAPPGGRPRQALAKISRVLPGPLRSRIEAVQATVGFTIPPRPGAIAVGGAIPALAEAIWQRRRVRASYQAPPEARRARAAGDEPRQPAA